MDSAISIGCEQGGPEGGFAAKLKVPLYQTLSRYVTSTHCSAIDKYSLLLRIDGSLATYGEEGNARLRFAKAGRYITVDIQIPERVWRPMAEAQTKWYLAGAVKGALKACTERLSRDKIAVNEVALLREVDAAIADYLSSGDAS